MITPVAANIKEALEEVVMVKDVWDTSVLCEQQFVDWKSTLWNDIRTDVMEDGAKGFVKEVREPNPYSIAHEPAYTFCAIILTAYEYQPVGLADIHKAYNS